MANIQNLHQQFFILVCHTYRHFFTLQRYDKKEPIPVITIHTSVRKQKVYLLTLLTLNGNCLSVRWLYGVGNLF